MSGAKVPVEDGLSCFAHERAKVPVEDGLSRGSQFVGAVLAGGAHRFPASVTGVAFCGHTR